jgi:hypothetical protein
MAVVLQVLIEKQVWHLIERINSTRFAPCFRLSKKKTAAVWLKCKGPTMPVPSGYKGMPAFPNGGVTFLHDYPLTLFKTVSFLPALLVHDSAKSGQRDRKK